MAYFVRRLGHRKILTKTVALCLDNCGKKTITHVSPSGRSVCSEDSYTYQDSCESGLYNDTSFQCIRFQPFQESSWNTLCDHSLKELYVYLTNILYGCHYFIISNSYALFPVENFARFCAKLF